VEYVKGTIPKAFLTLVKETAQSIVSAGGKVFLYEREGWTFHAKGIWITATDGRNNIDSHHPELIKEPSSLLATIIGSSNYGARSEHIDVESNCIIVFKDYSSDDDNFCHNVKKSIAAEWNDMCQPSKEWKEENSANDDSTSIMRLVLELLRRYL
jgi:phosphatidylserine/phosphatidylglycerophosphate/cardiolipin synthase-like enzyme